MSYLIPFQKKFNTSLASFLDQKKQKFSQFHPRAQDMFDYMSEFLLTGGKRFRPALFYYAYSSGRANSGIDPLIFSFVFELFHTFALLHDDIIDHAPLRRGHETIHTKYGIAPALLTGDLALMLADEIFMDSLQTCTISPFDKNKVINLYNSYKQELITGQYLDCIHIQETSLIMLMKTAMYSFVRPVKFGFLLAGQGESYENWDSILREAGILFQIKDDYNGVFSDEQTIGKSTVSDVEEGKNTDIVKLFLDRATPQEKRKFQSFFGKKTSPAEFQWYKTVLLEKKIDINIREMIHKRVMSIEKQIGISMKRQTSFYGLIQELLSLINHFPQAS